MADCSCNNFPASLGNVTFGANVGIGAAPPPYPLTVEAGPNSTVPAVAVVAGTLGAASGLQIGLLSNPVQGVSSTGSLVGMYTRVDTAASAITLADAVGLEIDNPERGAGSTITTAAGLLIGNITSGTSNFSIYAGTAPSSFAGSVGIGTTAPAYPLDVNGSIHCGSVVCGATTVADSGGCYYAS